jgi:hypothetical protein
MAMPALFSFEELIDPIFPDEAENSSRDSWFFEKHAGRKNACHTCFKIKNSPHLPVQPQGKSFCKS